MSEGIMREFRWRDKILLGLPIFWLIAGLVNGFLRLSTYLLGDGRPVEELYWALIWLAFAALGAVCVPVWARKWYIRLTEDEIIMSGPSFFKKFRYTIRWDSIETVDKFSENYTRLLLKDGSKAAIWYHGLYFREKDALRKILSERLSAPLPPGLSQQ